MRKNNGSQYYLIGIFVIATILSLILIISSHEISHFKFDKILYVFLASFLYILYQLFINKSYNEGGNISISYPLSMTSPLFIPIWAYFFINERISFTTIIGILIIVLGAISIQIQKFSITEIRNLFKFNDKFKAARFAIAASLAYSFGVIVDKYVVSFFTLGNYLFILLLFMSINMTLFQLLSKDFGFPKYFANNWRYLIKGGIALMLSFLFFRYALQNIPVSIAVPVRQTSILFAVFFGVVFLKEPFKIEKLIAILLIITGVLIINISSG